MKLARNRFVKFLYICLGSLFFSIGLIGIVVPGLPTTIFLLIAAAFYFRSSERLYNWLLEHKVYGKFISDFHKYRAMPRKSKIIAFLMMWSMIAVSTIFFIQIFWIRAVVILSGIIGTVVILKVKTLERLN